MKKQMVLIIAILFFISCNEVGSSYEQITAIKTVSQRINDLNKTKPEIKNSEDQLALMLEKPLYLEYEYPIREFESYVIKYRFNTLGCIEIKLDTYLNNQDDAQKVYDAIINDLNVNSTFEKTKKGTDFYQWVNSVSKKVIEIDIQHIERGIISLTIFLEN